MFLDVRSRSGKPRSQGLTFVLDPGLTFGMFADIMRSFAPHIDFVKFGWATGVITPQLDQKIGLLQEYGIDYWFGGTLFELSYAQGRLAEMVHWIRNLGCGYFELSDGILSLTARQRMELIRDLSQEFKVFAEIGSKDSNIVMNPTQWVSRIKNDLQAGAWMVIGEGRESGTAGIYRSNGEVREDLIHEIMDAGIDINRMFFEAPLKHQQVWFINTLGHEVNLGNISARDILNVESLRLGLRSDTVAMSDASCRHWSRQGQ